MKNTLLFRKSNALLFWSLAFLFLLNTQVSWGQTTVFSDDFSANTSATYVTSGAINTTNWSVTRSGVDWGARRNVSTTDRLELTNDVSVSGNADGWAFASIPVSNFSSPYNSTPSSNVGDVTWTFNMRQIRATPAGFSAVASYGMAVVLGGTSTSANTTGTGYAVTMGASGFLRLVSYNNGLQGTQASIIAGSTNVGTNYYSIRVVYTPSTNTWQLFARSDGASAFTDPTTGTALTQVGSGTVNSTFTSTSLTNFGVYWQGSTAANQTSFFDNVKVTVTPPTPTVSSISPTSVAAGSPQFSLNVTGTNFVSGLSTVTWGGSNRTTTFNSATSLTATIPATDVASTGTALVGVTTTGAAASSGTQTFTISAANAPTKLVITNVSPDTPSKNTSFSVTVQAQDASNNPQVVGGSGITVNLAKTTGTGTLSGTASGTIASNANSITFTGLTYNVAETGVVLTASDGTTSLTSGTTTFNVLESATYLTIENVPTVGSPATNLTSFTVSARRPDASIDANYSGNITISKASGPGTISGTLTKTPVNGVATFNDIQFNTAGVYTISAAAPSPSLTGVTSGAISISESLATYPFTSNLAATGVNANATATNVAPTVITGAISSGYYNTSATWGTVINTGQYIEFNITPNTGYLLSLTTLNFNALSTSAGATNFVIRSSIDGYSSNLGIGEYTLARLSAAPVAPTYAFSIAFGGSFTNLTGGVTFRLYPYGGASSGNFRIDDLTYLGYMTQNTSPYLSSSVSSLADFGSIAVGSNATGVSFNLSGGNLTTSPITVSAPSTDFQVSLSSGSGYGATVDVTFTPATLASTPVFVRFSPQSGGAKSGNVTFSGGGVTTNLPTVAVSGTGIGSITPSTSTLSLGTTVPVGTNTESSFTVSAANLSPVSGNLTVSVAAPFTVSTSATGGAAGSASVTLPYTAGALSSTTVYVQYNPIAVGSASQTLTISGGGTSATVSVTATSVTSVFYSKSSGNLDSLATWGTGTDGNGTQPASFTSGNATFTIANQTAATIGAAWTVSGTASKVIVTNGVNFTVPSGFAFVGTIDVNDGGTLTLQNTTIPTFGTLATTSTVDYASASSQTISAANYGNLSNSGNGARVLASSGTIGIAGTNTPTTGARTITGSTVNYNGTTPQIVAATTYNNLTVSNPAGSTTGGYITVNRTLLVSENLTIASFDNLTLSGTNTLLNVAANKTVTVNGKLINQASALAITSISSTTTTATVTTSTAHGLAVGQRVLINGNGTANYNISTPVTILTVPNANTFTYAISSFNGSGTGGVASVYPFTTTTGSVITFPSSSSTYIHAQNGGYILNSAFTTGVTYNNASTIVVTGITSTIAFLPTSCPNVIWDSAGQTHQSNFISATPVTINGYLRILSTGTGYIAIGQAATPRVLNVTGNLEIGFGNLYVVGAGTAATANQTINVTGNLNLQSGAASASIINLNAGTTAASTGKGTLNLTGNIIIAEAIETIITETNTNATGNLVFNGSSAQTVYTSFFPLVVGADVTINNAAGLTLNTDMSVGGALTFTAGKITTGSNKVIANGTVSGGGTGWVIGNLQKPITATGARVFEIGGASFYRPVNLNVGTLTTPGTLMASVSQADGNQPNLGTSTLNSAKTVKRYFTLTSGGGLAMNYDAVFNYINQLPTTEVDVPTAANTANFIVGNYNGGWNYPTVGTKTTTSTQATGISTFGDFVIGQQLNPTITTSPNSFTGLTYVEGSGPSAESGTFSITASDLSPASGNITLTPSSNIEVYDGSAWQSTAFTVGYSGGVLSTTSIYKVRLKAGLTAGSFSSESVGLSGGGTSATVNVSGSVTSLSSPICALSTAVAPGADQTRCQGFTADTLTATITAAGTTGSPSYSYQWYYNTTNDNTTFTNLVGTGATFVPPTTGSEGTRYYFCVGYSNNVECGPQTATTSSLASATVKVIVNASPVGAVSIAETSGTTNNDGTICNGASVTLTASGGSSYLWSTTATTAAITVSPATTTSYTVTVTNAANCSVDVASTITVNALPTTPTITPSGTVALCLGETTTLTSSASPNTYQWSNSGTTQAITSVGAGTYTVRVTDTNGCQSAASAATTVTVASALVPGAVAAFSSAPNTGTTVVISQVYGGGGLTSATYKNDFIELYNPTASAQSLAGWSVQQASGTGNSWTVTNLSGSIPAGGYYLVQGAGGATGATLPTADATGTFNMSATATKVVLASTTVAYGVTCPSTSVIDFFGVGSTTNCSEGTVATALSGNVLSYQRKNSGCTDSGNNNNDFTNNTTASARNSGSPTNSCAVLLETICSTVTPSAMTVAAASGSTGPYTYQWYKNDSLTTAPSGSTVPVGWTAVGSPGLSYTSGTLSQDTTFACYVTATGCGSGTSAWASGYRQVKVNAVPSQTITALSSTVCANSTGNTASVPVTAGATYNWTISGGTITAGQTGSTVTYTAGTGSSLTLNCVVTSSAGCASAGAQNTSVTVDAPAAPTGALTIVNSTCASACTVSGGSIAIGDVSANGGGTLEYSTDAGVTWSSTLPTYAAPQTIIASVVNGSGCRSASFQVGTTVAGVCTTPAAPTGSLAITDSTCASACTVTGGSIAIGTVSGTGGTLEYSTDNGVTWGSLPSYAAPQTIIASVINASGCRSLTTSVGATVAGTCTTPAAPTGSLAITDSTCASACTVTGGSIAIGTVSGTGGTLEYSTDNGVIWGSLPTYAAPQTIIASVINSGGCRSGNTTVGATIAGTCTTPATPTISAGGPTTFCSGGSVLLTSSAGSGYLWSNGATTISTSVTTSGNYTVQVRNASGCLSLASDPTTVTVTAQPEWFADVDNDGYSSSLAASIFSCTQPSGYKLASQLVNGGVGSLGTDCVDIPSDLSVNPLNVLPVNINPGRSEVCYNNVDDNCNGTKSEGCAAVPVTVV
ncbi:lamin tail domain-containing protein, partial [Flavobacterium paronense]